MKAAQWSRQRALVSMRRRSAAAPALGVEVRVDVRPPSIWRLVADIPDKGLVTVRRKGKPARVEEVSLGMPALHNLRDWKQHNRVTKCHKAQLDAAISQLGEIYDGGAVRMARPESILRCQLQQGQGFDVLIIRRAPRPLDAAIQVGEWKRGGRQLYGDNLESSGKPTRDWLAKKVFGLDCDSSPLLRWHVGQEYLAKAYQLEIVIALAADCECCGLPRLPAMWLRGEL